MKDIALPVSITADVCWHAGRIIVARHSGVQLVVEAWSSDLSSVQPLFETAMPGGNAGARVHSFQGIVWLAYRDAHDRGHLVRLDTGATQDLTPFYNGGRPFAFGEGQCAWQTTVLTANVIALGQGVASAREVTFPDMVPTGLSHIANGVVYSWESQRLLHPWAVGFASCQPFVFGEDFANRGLVGAVAGRDGRLLLWRDGQMHDPRVDVNADHAAVVAWATGGTARLAIVTASDLVPVVPDPPAPAPTPAPDPRPAPVPTPAPSPETEKMQLPDNVRSLLIRFAQKFPLPQTPGGGEEHENRCREWCRKLAEQVRFATQDPTWGVKKSAGPQSKDTIARDLGNGSLAVFDLMTGAGTGAPVLNQQPSGETVTGQTFVPVNPVNHLDGGAPHPEPLSALTAAETAAVRALIAEALVPVNAEIARLRQELAQHQAAHP